jgi:hypothetical protein
MSVFLADLDLNDEFMITKVGTNFGSETGIDLNDEIGYNHGLD